MHQLRLSIILFSLLSGHLLSAQTLGLQWAKLVSTPFNPSVYPQDNAVDSDGNYYVASQYQQQIDLDPSAAVQMIYPVSGLDIYIAKYDSSGNYVWSFVIAGDQEDRIGSMELIDNKLYISGNTASSNLDLDPGPDSTSINGENIFYAVYDLNSTLLNYGVMSSNGTTNCNCSANDIQQDADKNIYIFGEANISVDFNPSNSDSIFLPDWGAYLAKYDSTGNLIWLRSFPNSSGAGNINASSFTITPQNKLLLAGTYTYTILFDSGIVVPYTTNATIWYAEYDTANNYLWHKILPRTGIHSDYLLQAETDQSGYIYLRGVSGDGTDVDPGNDSSIIASTSVIFISKYTPNGDYIWHGYFDEAYNYNYIMRNGDMQVLDNGDFFIANPISSSIDIDLSPNTHFPTLDTTTSYFIAKYNAFGQLQNYGVIEGLGFSTISNIEINETTKSIHTTSVMTTMGNIDIDPGPSISYISGTGITHAKYLYENNTISGIVYADLNNNTSFDAGDALIPNFLLTTSPLNTQYATNNNGYYESYAASGNYTVFPLSTIPYYSLITDSCTATFINPNNEIDSLNNFILQPLGTVNDLSISITTLSIPRPGFDNIYRVTYTNKGNTTLNGDVTLNIDVNQTYISSSVIPDNITATELTWNFSSLNPFEQINIDVTFNTLASANIGTFANTSVTVNPVLNDTMPANNSDTIHQVILGSYDPNYKEVSDSILFTNQALHEITYTVHFQNTGTYPATTVIVTDTLSSFLNLNTLEVISSSHNNTLSIHPQNVIQFTFNNIQLADSFSNEPASHGYIKFKAHTNNNLLPGDIIENTAAIYFDYNEAIITNTVSTLITTPTSLSSIEQVNEVLLYPNPATSELIVKLNGDNRNSNFKIVDTFGRIILRGTLDSNSHRININSITSGLYNMIILNPERTISKSFIKF